MTRSMPEWSQVLIDAPPNFDFTELCVVSHLEAYYYQEPRRSSGVTQAEDWEALPWGEEVTGPRATTSTLGHVVHRCPYLPLLRR